MPAVFDITFANLREDLSGLGHAVLPPRFRGIGLRNSGKGLSC